MDENAPTKSGIICPSFFIRAQRTFPPRPLQDGPDCLLTIRLEVLAQKVTLQHCSLHEPLTTDATLDVPGGGGCRPRVVVRVVRVALWRLC